MGHAHLSWEFSVALRVIELNWGTRSSGEEGVVNSSV